MQRSLILHTSLPILALHRNRDQVSSHTPRSTRNTIFYTVARPILSVATRASFRRQRRQPKPLCWTIARGGRIFRPACPHKETDSSPSQADQDRPGPTHTPCPRHTP